VATLNAAFMRLPDGFGREKRSDYGLHVSNPFWRWSGAHLKISGEILGKLNGVRTRGGKLLLQQGPIKPRAWVVLAARSNMFMAGNMTNRIIQDDCATKRCKRLVLWAVKAITFKSFHFDTNGIVVAIVPTAKSG